MFNLLLSILLWVPSQAQVASKVEWLSATTHDFGDIKRGVPAKVDFRFKNISQDTLLIDNVRASCSCTASDWSEEVVVPGREGVIGIEYDAKREGYFSKKINVFFSGQRKPEKLTIEGYVE
ncbi:MAG: DUF1573 domain-containing protein [Saprospiraceae bacterium]